MGIIGKVENLPNAVWSDCIARNEPCIVSLTDQCLILVAIKMIKQASKILVNLLHFGFTSVICYNLEM